MQLTKKKMILEHLVVGKLTKGNNVNQVIVWIDIQKIHMWNINFYRAYGFTYVQNCVYGIKHLLMTCYLVLLV